MRQLVRPPMLLATVLAGCLNLAAVAEAHDRQGHQRQVRSFAHQPFASRQVPRWSGQRHDGPRFAQRHDPRWSGQGRDRRWSGPPSGLRAFTLPPRHRPGFGYRDPGMWSGHRRQVLRFAERPPVPLSRQPGFRVLSGRQILPTVGIPIRPLFARPARPFIARPNHHFPTFVRVFPGPGFAPHGGFLTSPGGFGIPHRSGGLTIILRDPAGLPPWQ